MYIKNILVTIKNNTSQNQCCILSAETKGIRQYRFAIKISGNTGHIVQIAIRIRVLKVNGWRNYVDL